MKKLENKVAIVTGASKGTGQPDDIAKVAVFLASDDSGWVTGEKIFVSGGIFGL